MKLLCLHGPEVYREIALDEGLEYQIGREPSGDSEPIVLNSPTVSRNHLRLYHNGSVWMIEDLKSFNGVLVNRRKVFNQEIQEGDQIDIGEYQFVFTNNVEHYKNITNKKEITTTRQQGKSERKKRKGSDKKAKSRFDWREIKDQIVERWDSLEFRWKLISILVVVGLLLHSSIFIPLQRMAEEKLLQESLVGGRLFAEQLADEYRMQESGSIAVVNCEAFALSSQSILQAYVLDRQLNVRCPLGETSPVPSLVRVAQEEGSFMTSCTLEMKVQEGESCWMVEPVFGKGARTDLIGFSVIQYFPGRVAEALDSFDSFYWQSLLLVLLILGFIGNFFHIQVARSLRKLTDEVHLLFTGTVQKLEHFDSFAALNPLVDEINRLNSQSNQPLSSDPSSPGPEADFLQSLLEQVLLLEERAVMVVDQENQILAISSSLPDIVPLQEEYLSAHIMDGIGDTHLQGELVGFLNEISGSSEILDKTLALSDRMVSVRGMPIFRNGEQVATLLIF